MSDRGNVHSNQDHAFCSPIPDRGRSYYRTRQSQWSREKQYVPGLPPFLPSTIPKDELDALLVRFRIEEIGYKLQNNLLDLELRARSPSPPPQYDSMGKRTNTREQRAKERLMGERQRLVEKTKSIYPSFRPPSNYRPLNTKKTAKIYIPVKEYPLYNFIGLIIGPRGSTQKEMERETGAKIAIRGRGSTKEGKGRTNGSEDEELHVLITADTQEALMEAEGRVRKLLIPVEEGKNEHKRQQLRKLAEYNGTLRDHGMEVDREEFRSFNVPNVLCKYCGEVSHPSSDCPQRDKLPTLTLEEEYIEYLASIG